MADLLIVDDDEDLSSLLAEVLEDRGHQVRVARDGRQGLWCVEQQKPDVVLLDVEMPVLDGPGMAYGLFISDLGRELIPIVLLSGAAQLARLAGRIGTPYFLSKPYPLEVLFDVLHRALTERSPPHAHHLLDQAAP